LAACKICKNESSNTFYELKELMFGTGERFPYFQCSKCQCLQIEQLPDDMAKYYPDDYYSFSETPNIINSSIKKFLLFHRYRQCLFGGDLLGRILLKFLKRSPELEMMKKAGIKEGMSVLDVGCGSGLVLYLMNLAGMKNLVGIDPYIKHDIHYSDELSILKKDIYEMEGKWDFIFVNHVLEHIDDQQKFFNEVYKKLHANGTCLVRIPTCSSYAWEYYRENWIQSDPPRHFYIHSIESIQQLVASSNLKIKEIIYDSTSFQFIGSEQAIKGIHLNSNESYIKNKETSVFSKKEIQSFNKKTIELNKQKKGDQIAVIISH
jgi:2-polyprenyl-3-methyl-5-hydroxy-6-metoxy-1,4-benzoquinol methylase